MTHRESITIVMGPTGSGKSALALRIADARPAVIINADAMQMVADLRVLSARPTVEEEAQAEHALYGVLDATEPTSVAVWLRLVAPIIRDAWAAGKQPLLVGGTGMYVKALMEGLNDIPPVPDSLRLHIRTMGDVAIRAELERCDPVMASRLKPGDSQRNARALEVWQATRRSLAEWQEQKATPLFPEAVFRPFVILPEREVLYPRLDARFVKMLEHGALEEVKALYARGLAADTPILRAHGAPELAAYLAGSMELNEAIDKGQQNTRNYAKRQMTWIRQQMQGATVVNADTDVGIFI